MLVNLTYLLELQAQRIYEESYKFHIHISTIKQ